IRILSGNGYSVLDASDGMEALEIIRNKKTAEIDILITDVIMPRMGGKELTEKLKELHIEFKVIYISGYTDNSISGQGILSEGENFLHKPFTPTQLLQKIREVLDK
ncbi:MAG: response regulator, partial [Candidatus Latescibacteria bacterium]|nr:response regulator [Candidatus Latescibacterota bacterium]